MPKVQRLRVMAKQRMSVCLVILVLGSVTAALYFGGRPRQYKSERFLMDTLVSISVYGRDADRLKAAVTEAYAEMQRLADLADGFPQPGTAAYSTSDVCRINEQAGKKPVRVDKDIIAMVLLAKKYGTLSEGAFDVTIGPVMDLWGFGGKSPHVPPAGILGEVRRLVDSEELVVDERDRTVFLRKAGMKLDLGAIAKGYATEQAVEVLKRHGIRRALIDAGGNIRVLGKNPRSTPWRIGIKNPRKADAILAVLSLEDAAAVTSGDYYRFFEAGGKRYHHILDPRTGYPAGASMSVTVVTRDAGLADVLSTAFFVLEPEKALQMAKKLEGVDLLIVAADGRILHTPGLLGRVEVQAGERFRYDQGR